MIAAEYRALSLKLHPDRPGGDKAAFARVAAAYAVLSDPVQRRDLDSFLDSGLDVSYADWLARRAVAGGATVHFGVTRPQDQLAAASPAPAEPQSSPAPARLEPTRCPSCSIVYLRNHNCAMANTRSSSRP